MTVNTVQGEGQQRAVAMGRILAFWLYTASRTLQALGSRAFSECPGLALLVPLAPPALPTLPRQTCNSPVMSSPRAWSEYTVPSQFLSPPAGYRHHQEPLQTSPPPSLLLLRAHLAGRIPLPSAHSSYFYYICSALSALSSDFKSL